MDRIYLMPMVTVGNKRTPKYYALFASSGLSWDAVDYGPEPACLVCVRNVDAIHATLVADSEVVALPEDLDQQIGAQLTLVQNALAGIHFPENWVQATYTYRQVLRVLCLCCMFLQRFAGKLDGVRVFESGITLATTVNSLPANVRTALRDAATSFGFDLTGFNAKTLRNAIKSMADQFTTIEFYGLGQIL